MIILYSSVLIYRKTSQIVPFISFISPHLTVQTSKIFFAFISNLQSIRTFIVIRTFNFLKGLYFVKIWEASLY